MKEDINVCRPKEVRFNNLEKNNDTKDSKRSFIKLPKEIVSLKDRLLEPEDEILTEELFSKIQYDEVLCGIIVILSIFTSCIYRELCYSDESQCNSSNNRIVAILVINSILFFLYCKILDFIN